MNGGTLRFIGWAGCQLASARLIALALASFWLARLAGADTALIPPIQVLTEDSAYIARVRIDSRKPVTFDVDGESDTCGYMFSAHVVESLKGEATELLFFGDVESGFVDLDRDYVALIFDRRGDDTALEKAVRSQLGARNLQNIKCQLEASRLFVRSAPHTLIPFQHRRGEEPGSIARDRLGVLATALPPNEATGGSVEWTVLRRSMLDLLGR